MTGKGSIKHNNRSFTAANVDKERTHLNVTFCNEGLKMVYHELFDDAIASYNAGKKKTRDKISDYYEHIRQGKQEKLFHEAIFQIGNVSNCACGTESGERAAAALTAFAENFQERNPHLRVFNMVLHLDEATPHLHVDFVPFATEQTRGPTTRVSMKQALKQQGFVGKSRNETEWKFWMEREKESLKEFATDQEFEVISLGNTRPHMDLPEYKNAVRELERVQKETENEEKKNAKLKVENKALEDTQKLLKRAERVNVSLDAIRPEKGLLGAVKGVTVEDVERLKLMAVENVELKHKVAVLENENLRLTAKIPSFVEQLQNGQKLESLNRINAELSEENKCLRESLDNERNFTGRLIDGIGQVLDYLEDHLPEQLLHLLEKAKLLLPIKEIRQQKQHKQDKGSIEL